MHINQRFLLLLILVIGLEFSLWSKFDLFEWSKFSSFSLLNSGTGSGFMKTFDSRNNDSQNITVTKTGSCSVGPALPNFISPRSDMPHRTRAINEYKLGICRTPKSGSEAVTRAVVYLKYDNSTEQGKHIRMKANSTLYMYRLYFKLPHAPEEAFKNDTNWTKVIIIRNPLDRFLSAFAHWCITENACHGYTLVNFTAFVKKTYRVLSELSRGRRPRFSFKALYHFYPMTWFCSGLTAAKLKHYHVVKQDSPSFVEDLVAVVRNTNVGDDKLMDMVEGLRVQGHSTDSSYKEQLKEQLRNDPDAWTCLQKIVRNNAQLFNYTIEM